MKRQKKKGTTNERAINFINYKIYECSLIKVKEVVLFDLISFIPIRLSWDLRRLLC